MSARPDFAVCIVKIALLTFTSQSKTYWCLSAIQTVMTSGSSGSSDLGKKPRGFLRNLSFYFSPASCTATAEKARRNLKLWASFSEIYNLLSSRGYTTLDLTNSILLLRRRRNLQLHKKKLLFSWRSLKVKMSIKVLSYVPGNSHRVSSQLERTYPATSKKISRYWCYL